MALGSGCAGLSAGHSSSSATSGAEPPAPCRIELPQNGTTGYLWEWSVAPQEGVVLLSDDFVPSNPDMVGAPGIRVFTFGPGQKRNGDVKIHFEMRRPWEPREIPPVETATFRYRLQRNGTMQALPPETP